MIASCLKLSEGTQSCLGYLQLACRSTKHHQPFIFAQSANHTRAGAVVTRPVSISAGHFPHQCDSCYETLFTPRRNFPACYLLLTSCKASGARLSVLSGGLHRGTSTALIRDVVLGKALALSLVRLQLAQSHASFPGESKQTTVLVAAHSKGERAEVKHSVVRTANGLHSSPAVVASIAQTRQRLQ